MLYYWEDIDSQFEEAEVLDHVVYDYDTYITCPKCGTKLGRSRWEKPLQIRMYGKLMKRNGFPDFLVCNGAIVDILVSEKVKVAYEESDLTGIECFEPIDEMRLHKKDHTDNNRVPHYYKIEIKTSAIALNHDLTEIVYGDDNNRPICSVCNPRGKNIDFERHLVFNMEMYEGFDIFCTYELGYTVFFSQKFVEFCKEKGFVNCCFKEIEKMGDDDDWLFDYL